MKRVGTGTRVLNFLVDTILIFFISLAFSKWYNFQVYYWHYPPLVPYFFFFATQVVYYFLFELFTTRTPGKWLTISKVVSKNGQKANIIQLLIRSVSRILLIDCFFIPFFDGRTLHDLLSRTEVIEA